jgi:hypothetical protein
MQLRQPVVGHQKVVQVPVPLLPIALLLLQLVGVRLVVRLPLVVRLGRLPAARHRLGPTRQRVRFRAVYRQRSPSALRTLPPVPPVTTVLLLLVQGQHLDTLVHQLGPPLRTAILQLLAALAKQVQVVRLEAAKALLRQILEVEQHLTDQHLIAGPKALIGGFMKQKVIAVAITFVSLAAYGADPASMAGTAQATTQSTSQSANVQPQTTIPADKSKAQSASSTGSNGQSGQWVDSWTLLSRGWKQFDDTGK